MICRLTTSHALPRIEVADQRCLHWYAHYFRYLHSGFSLCFSANAVDMAFQKSIHACVFNYSGGMTYCSNGLKTMCGCCSKNLPSSVLPSSHC